MVEDGETKAAAPECKNGLGWVYNAGYCYMFTSFHVDFLEAEELCNMAGGYLTAITTAAENNFLKKVLGAINPRDGTDYWIGGLDDNRNKQLQWMTGIYRCFDQGMGYAL